MGIAENIRNINAKLPSAVRLVAVSKFHPLENILEAYDAGQRVFAESRPQELLAKVRSLSELSTNSISEPDTQHSKSGTSSSEVGASTIGFSVTKEPCKCSDIGVFDKGKVVDNFVDKCGENRRFEDIEWHFIGHLQTNKLKMVLPYVTLVQSVDSERLLSAIDAWGRENSKITNVLLECHIASEESKQGFAAEEILDLLSRASDFKNVRLCGLMGMATFTDNKDVIRSDFAKIRDLYDKIRAGLGDSSAAVNSEQEVVRFTPVVREALSGFRELSIGMSDDYLIALEYGATMVRIGTDIFGPRVY